MAETTEISEHLIEIEKIFAGKNPVLYKILPKFFFSYLKRIIHQDIINAAIYKHRDKSGLDFVANILIEFGINVEVLSSRSSRAIDHPTNSPLHQFTNSPVHQFTSSSVHQFTSYVPNRFWF